MNRFGLLRALRQFSRVAAKVIFLAAVAAFALWAWLEDDVPTEYGIGAGLIGLLVALSGRWISPPRSPGA